MDSFSFHAGGEGAGEDRLRAPSPAAARPPAAPAGRPVPLARAVLAALAAAAFLAPLASADEPAQGLDRARVYRIAVDENYPPFSFADGKGGMTGFDPDIARALCVDMKLRCVIVPTPFDDIIPGITAGKLDVGATGFGATPERMAVVDFTDKYYRSTTIFIQYGDAFSDIDPDTLRGKRIGVQKDSIQERYAREHFSALAEIKVYDDPGLIFAAMKEGACDLALADGLATFSFIMSEEGDGFDTAGDPMPLDVESRMAISKGLPALRSEMNRSILRIRQSGVYDAINRKYFSFSIY
ncbi:MAG: transporter substrate-binding domain-containing protein [Deltaproteobacteria bacterium]|jgi:ABC-type amino acid transport substrate-binding protein|nr:transporter substrate-binding domain-containing protein [Deltaproteobacteria bacterium]